MQSGSIRKATVGAVIAISLAGCGGGGGSSSGGSGAGGGGADTSNPLYTAHIHVDMVSGKVTVIPYNPYMGKATTVLASNLVKDAKTGQVHIQFQVTNNLATKIGSSHGVHLLYNFLGSIDPVAQAHGVTVSPFSDPNAPGYSKGVPAATTFNTPYGVMADGPDGGWYICDLANNLVRVLQPNRGGGVTIDTANGLQSDGLLSVNQPAAITSDGAVVTAGGNAVRRLQEHLAGPHGDQGTYYVYLPLAGTGAPGFVNGIGTAATFSHPQGITNTNEALPTYYVADTGNNVIRKVYPVTTNGHFTYYVSTFSGSGAAGLKDGSATSAQFNRPTGIDMDDSGNLYVADSGNSAIRIVLNDGSVTTIAGIAGKGFADGPGDLAELNLPHSLAVTRAGASGKSVPPLMYIADSGNHSVRQLRFIGPTRGADQQPLHIEDLSNWQMTTIAGSYLTSVSTAGAGDVARFVSPAAVTAPPVNGSMPMILCDSGNSLVSKITGTFPVLPPAPAFVDGSAITLSGTSYQGRTLTGTLSPGVTSGFDDWSFAPPAGTSSFDFTITVDAPVASA